MALSGTILAGFIAVTNMPYNAVSASMPTVVNDVGRAFFAQGWGFFTRDPKGPFYYGYRFDQNIVEVDQSRKFLGLDRSPQVRQEVLKRAAEKVDDRQWQDCESSDLKSCSEKVADSKAINVPSTDNINAVCGTVALIEHTPTKWSWLDLAPSLELQVSKVSIECD